VVGSIEPLPSACYGICRRVEERDRRKEEVSLGRCRRTVSPGSDGTGKGEAGAKDEILGPRVCGFIFEQEYQRQKERIAPEEMASTLDAFFDAIPPDQRYHVELRTESYLSKPVFDVLAQHGVRQVLSHWSRLPPLRKQFAKSGKAVLNSGGRCVVRLTTPRGLRYEDAYAKAHPFSALVNGMLDPKMVEETAELMRTAVDRGVKIDVIANNRAGGNALLIARQVAERFLGG
jgi:hypothetical protein